VKAAVPLVLASSPRLLSSLFNRPLLKRIKKPRLHGAFFIYDFYPLSSLFLYSVAALLLYVQYATLLAPFTKIK
ncbi:MAG: hypothetical protein KDI13_10300, partial [Alphaproteobacteria bacterium]|nr:hypothetical protein [Alphaproteobacteria bacterium]